MDDDSLPRDRMLGLARAALVLLTVDPDRAHSLLGELVTLLEPVNCADVVSLSAERAKRRS